MIVRSWVLINILSISDTEEKVCPPHSGVGGTACVFPKSLVKGYISRDKVPPENCKKKGVYMTFHPEISFKKGVLFSLSLFGLLRNLKRGYKISLFTLFENQRKLINSRDQIPEIPASFEQCSGFRGVSKAGKACEKPAKGGFRNAGSPEIGGTFKGRERAYAYPK